MKQLLRLSSCRIACIRGRQTQCTVAHALSLQCFNIDVRQPIGIGRHGRVYRGEHRQSGHEVAIKMMLTHTADNAASLEKHAFDVLLSKSEKDPHLVDIFGQFSCSIAEAIEVGIQLPPIEATEAFVSCFVTSYLHGGSLMEVIKQRKQDRIIKTLMTYNLDDAVVDPTDHRLQLFNDRETMEVARCLGKALSFLHDRNIVHRDVKPLNLMYPNLSQNCSQLEIIDFSVAGVASKSAQMNCFTEKVGTKGFTAPEVLQMEFEPLQKTSCNVDGYSSKCDIFSAGCTLHAMVAGETPTVTYHPGVPTKVETALPKCVSIACRSLIEAMLMNEPRDRPTASEVLKLCSE